jgi:hypothetical protein
MMSAAILIRLSIEESGNWTYQYMTPATVLLVVYPQYPGMFFASSKPIAISGK